MSTVEYRRRRNRRRTLKLACSTPARYAERYQMQDGQCAICDVRKSTLDSDHDHDTMQPRGLLCSKCNRGLGFFLDDPLLLKNAAEYLILWKSENRK